MTRNKLDNETISIILGAEPRYETKSKYIMAKVRERNVNNTDHRRYIIDLLHLENYVLNGSHGFPSAMNFKRMQSGYEEEYLALLKEFKPEEYQNKLEERAKEIEDYKKSRLEIDKERKKSIEELTLFWKKCGGRVEFLGSDQGYQTKSRYIIDRLKERNINNYDDRQYIKDLLKIEKCVLNGVGGFASAMLFGNLRSKYEKEYYAIVKELNSEMYRRELKERAKEIKRQKETKLESQKQEKKDLEELTEFWKKCSGEVE